MALTWAAWGCPRRPYRRAWTAVGGSQPEGVNRKCLPLARTKARQQSGFQLSARVSSLKHFGHSVGLRASSSSRRFDVVAVSQRIRHRNPSITLAVYGHLFGDADERDHELSRSRTGGRAWERERVADNPVVNRSKSGHSADRKNVDGLARKVLNRKALKG